MTPTEKRVRIAELRGWSVVQGYARNGFYGYHNRQPSYDVAECPPSAIPDYLNSRDACAEFEAGLTADEIVKYVRELHWAVPGADLSSCFDGMDANAPFIFPAITAKPLQRCDAFLRVKGVLP